MGTQQILLIVLSVIIVGAAIAVGITMFNNQSYNSNKTAIAADAQNFATQVVQYYKTPESQGGADRIDANMTDTNIAAFIGWKTTTTGQTRTTTENGDYTITSIDGTSKKVQLYGLGKEEKGGKKPAVRTTITFPEGAISAKVIDVAADTYTIANIASAGFGS
jgi:hypothetical protein